MSADKITEPPQPQTSSQGLRAWIRALERTAKIACEPERTFPIVIDQLAERFGSAPALRDPHSSFSYQTLAERTHRYARWARAQRLAPGDTVCLMLANCAEYLAIWIGLTRAGMTVALINTHLVGDSLAHSIRIVNPRAIILGTEFADHLEAIAPQLGTEIDRWTYGGTHRSWPRIERALDTLEGHSLDPAEFALPSLKERALYIYTSGTTGLPKAAIVSHYRLMQWTHWFCGMMNITPEDRMYDCLPLYHSVGGVVAAGAPLVGGGTVVLREKFSASRFWEDVAKEQCTLFQYIGELCRYLLSSPPGDDETTHGLRLACGNGLRKDAWIPFQRRFRIPKILEYYASTEGNFSLYNCEGLPGSIGRVPPMLAHRHPIAIIQTDPTTNEPIRDKQGRCIPCGPAEPGEAIGQILTDPNHARFTFEGYADTLANDAKILRNAFDQGDLWYRTGDLMRRDEKGFYYFVDRTGDTFRWKGENVSTTEVSMILRSIPGVIDAATYGVHLPNTEGRAGMAAIVIDSSFRLSAFELTMSQRLPTYARPMFLRIVPSIDRTATFKSKLTDLKNQSYDIRVISDPVYVSLRQDQPYIPLANSIYDQICAGKVDI